LLSGDDPWHHASLDIHRAQSRLHIHEFALDFDQEECRAIRIPGEHIYGAPISVDVE